MAKKNTEKVAEETAMVKVPDEVIVDKIILLRDKKVMIDRDLALLYGVTTKRLNEQVKRNDKRFPPDFMFQVTAAEKEQLINAFEHLNGLKYSPALPYAFTEHGAVMLASVLNSDQAIAVNIQIVRVFTQIRQMLTDNTELRLEIEKIKRKADSQDKNIELVFQYLDELLEQKEKPEPPRNRIGYKLSSEE
jgi:hypothetical protein